jgi:hypothetical protein
LVDAAHGTSQSDGRVSGGGSHLLAEGGPNVAEYAGASIAPALALAGNDLSTSLVAPIGMTSEVPALAFATAAEALASAARSAVTLLGLEVPAEGASALADGEGIGPEHALEAVRLFLPAQVLGLAPAWGRGAVGEQDEDGWGWELTAAASLAVTVAGFWYCNRAATATARRRQGHAGRGALHAAWGVACVDPAGLDEDTTF